jgi:hypothetical protein
MTGLTGKNGVMYVSSMRACSSNVLAHWCNALRKGGQGVGHTELAGPLCHRASSARKAL